MCARVFAEFEALTGTASPRLAEMVPAIDQGLSPAMWTEIAPATQPLAGHVARCGSLPKASRHSSWLRFRPAMRQASVIHASLSVS